MGTGADMAEEDGGNERGQAPAPAIVQKNRVQVLLYRKDTALVEALEDIKRILRSTGSEFDFEVRDLSADAPIDVIPALESVEARKTRIRFKPGTIYVSKGEKSDKAFTIFADILRSQCADCDSERVFECEVLDCGKCTIECPCRGCKRVRPHGLVISRMFPRVISRNYPIQITPMIWLTQSKRKDIDCLNPNEISKLYATLASFIDKTVNSIILLEGIEYLITQNTFDIILKFIQHLNDKVVATKATIILPIDPHALSDNELHMLLRNTVPLEDMEKVK